MGKKAKRRSMRLALELAEMSGRMRDLAAELSYVGDEEIHAPTLTKTEMIGMAAAAAVQIEGEIAEARRLSRLCSNWAADPNVGAMYGKIALLSNELARLAARMKKANETSWAIVDGRVDVPFGETDDDVEFDDDPSDAAERSEDETDQD